MSEFTRPTLKKQTKGFACNILLLIPKFQELKAQNFNLCFYIVIFLGTIILYHCKEFQDMVHLRILVQNGMNYVLKDPENYSAAKTQTSNTPLDALRYSSWLTTADSYVKLYSCTCLGYPWTAEMAVDSTFKQPSPTPCFPLLAKAGTEDKSLSCLMPTFGQMTPTLKV